MKENFDTMPYVDTDYNIRKTPKIIKNYKMKKLTLFENEHYQNEKLGITYIAGDTIYGEMKIAIKNDMFIEQFHILLDYSYEGKSFYSELHAPMVIKTYDVHKQVQKGNVLTFRFLLDIPKTIFVGGDWSYITRCIAVFNDDIHRLYPRQIITRHYHLFLFNDIEIKPPKDILYMFEQFKQCNKFYINRKGMFYLSHQKMDANLIYNNKAHISLNLYNNDIYELGEREKIEKINLEVIDITDDMITLSCRPIVTRWKKYEVKTYHQDDRFEPFSYDIKRNQNPDYYIQFLESVYEYFKSYMKKKLK